jgi:hypothetical protein
MHADEAGDDGVAVEVDDGDVRCGGRGAAPVPSMIRTCVRRTAGPLTLTYLATAGESVGVWAWSVVKAKANESARTAER